jgi:nicotinate phosphoribosyltransferase
MANHCLLRLTDTFGSDFFFADFGDERAAAWRALRHDSGDPVKFGEKVISFYEQHGIDPKTKTIVFSDGLDIETIVQLYEHFNDRVGVVFGWGTTLTNDLGLPALNIVMKATEVNGTSTVKLSDVQTKHTGNPNMIERYTNEFTPVRASSPASAA